MIAAYFLLILGANGTSTTPFVTRDFCESALAAVMKLDPDVRGVCVSTGAIETRSE
jgi:hypothetical protein